MRIILISWLCLATLAIPVRAARGEVDAQQVREAIERGVAYLRRKQNTDGSWTEHVGFPGGVTALCALAMLNCGVPPDDPDLQRALNHLRRPEFKPEMTYVVALQTMAFCAAEPKRDALLIQRNAKWLEDHQIRSGDRRGCWGYSASQGNGDNSNAQFALLALHEAERVGVAVKDETWRMALGYWTKTQNNDGSWGYYEGVPGTGSMTSAGISSVLIASDRLNQGDAKVEGETIFCCGGQQENSPVEKALSWLGRGFSVHNNPGAGGGGAWLLYYLYGVERVGRLTNRRFIGQHDWYREGADLLVNLQDKQLTGSWTGVGSGEKEPQVGTALCLLFLSKGRRPVVVAKLKHAPADDWNHHRSDLANLVSYVESRWKRDLTWQTIDVAVASPDDLLQAPVLFLSGNQVPDFTEAQVKNLREYILGGGFIFAEACCTGREFDDGFRALVKRMFPEPEYRLQLLPPEHPVWNFEEPIKPNFVRPLWGVDIGCRTSIVYCPSYQDLKSPGCCWELARPSRDKSLNYPAAVREQIEAARSLGLNVLGYATNREVKEKLATPKLIKSNDPRDTFERAKVYVAKLKHTGGWNAAPGALSNLLVAISNQTGIRLSTDQREVAIFDDELYSYPLAFMHGRNSFELGQNERDKLRTFVERGGVLFGDAVCGSDAFAQSFQREMAAIFANHPLEAIPATHALFTSEYGGFDLPTVAFREPRARAAGGPQQSRQRQGKPELLGIKFEDRYGVIFSRYDLSCALERHESVECPGYTREDAARVGLNIVLYALQQ